LTQTKKILTTNPFNANLIVTELENAGNHCIARGDPSFFTRSSINFDMDNDELNFID
jgi:hypothetical protein